MFLLTALAIVAVLLSIVSSAIVRVVVFRAERNARVANYPSTDTGALFVVKNRRWQSVLFRVLGIVFLVVGSFFTFISIVESEQMDGPGPLISGAAIAVAGALFVIVAMGISRFHVGAFTDHLRVRPWFRPTRVVPLAEIGSVRPSFNRLGGIDVRHTSGTMLFTATGVSVGYNDIVFYLQQRSSRERATNPAPPGEVEPWQGRSLRAEWFPLPSGRKNILTSGVFLTAGEVTGNMYTRELVDLLNHRTGIVESITSDPLLFLCWPDSASPTSIAWESLKDLPLDSLALLVDPMDSDAAAVLTGSELTTFSTWVRDLPR
ncbi:hypothetical protein [Arthrobacter sp. RIT-PI-e]|uniref:hypothetical protein n=1 Tax=Arthrobacter sp. RIT-PI-e TaxID=1681197 RepID=UPI0006761747|nr:hypothetical protein [Arthrobacter sp. RIT-PI-e]